MSTATTVDLIELPKVLDPDAILARLQEVCLQERELRILLRAARERERLRGRRPAKGREKSR
jgi:hypothetical protein